MEWWNQNIPVGALGGSTSPPSPTRSLDCATLLNSFVWTDITAEFSLDLWLYPSQKQKWKLRSLGGLNLFQSFLFFQRIFFPLWEKRKEKRSMTLIMGFFKISFRGNVCSQVNGACSLHWMGLPVFLFSTFIFWLNIA